MAPLFEAVYGVSLPDRVLMVTGPRDALPQSHPAFGKNVVAGKASAYVCIGTSCSLPITDASQLTSVLTDSRRINGGRQ